MPGTPARNAPKPPHTHAYKRSSTPDLPDKGYSDILQTAPGSARLPRTVSERFPAAPRQNLHSSAPIGFHPIAHTTTQPTLPKLPGAKRRPHANFHWNPAAQNYQSGP